MLLAAENAQGDVVDKRPPRIPSARRIWDGTGCERGRDEALASATPSLGRNREEADTIDFSDLRRPIRIGNFQVQG